MKKRAFLAPIAASAAVLLGAATSSVAVPRDQHEFIEREQATLARPDTVGDNFVIERPNSDGVAFAAHSSHVSHASHASHVSHRSHYSSS